ncbi:MAG TPA: hypothetical protein VIH30_00545, partial [Aquirhabdus sp.]
SKPDWEKIELLYRAGLLSLREIAELHPETNHVSITRRAKKEGWVRDLSAKIKAKAESIVTKSNVTTVVTEDQRVTETAVIEANATVIANVRMEHRKDIRRARSIAMSLFDELELQVGAENVALLEEFGEIMRDEDERGIDKRNDLYMKIISLGSRSTTMRTLAESLKTVISLEREAYNLDEVAQPAAQDEWNVNVIRAIKP